MFARKKKKKQTINKHILRKRILVFYYDKITMYRTHDIFYFSKRSPDAMKITNIILYRRNT